MRFLLLFFVLPFSILLPILILIYIYDPFMIYHKPYFREVTYHDDMRIQAKGIIDNYDFDSYILGSSMLTWSSGELASSKIGGKFVNISLDGSTFNERAIILEYILKTKHPKHIIYSLDPLMMLMALTQDTAKFDYLYDESFLNDFKIYYNMDFLFCALSFSGSEKCVGSNVSLEKLMDWDKFDIKTFGGFENWVKYYNYENQSTELRAFMKQFKNIKKVSSFIPINGNLDISKQFNYVNKHLFSIVEKYPNTKFSIIIPPYSRLYYRINDPTIFYGYAQLISSIIMANKNDNVTFYGFDHLDYPDNIANYKDLNHYYKDMNNLQIEAIASNSFVLNKDNILPYLRYVEQKIIAYDPQVLLDELHRFTTAN